MWISYKTSFAPWYGTLKNYYRRGNEVGLKQTTQGVRFCIYNYDLGFCLNMFICSWKWHSICLLAPLFLVIWLFHWHLLPTPSKLTSWPSPMSLALLVFHNSLIILFSFWSPFDVSFANFPLLTPQIQTFQHSSLFLSLSPFLWQRSPSIPIFPRCSNKQHLSQPRLLPYISNPHWLFLPFVAAHLKNSKGWTAQQPLPLENPQVITHKRDRSENVQFNPSVKCTQIN